MRKFICIILALVVCFCGYNIIDILRKDAKQAAEHEELLNYKPSISITGIDDNKKETIPIEIIQPETNEKATLPSDTEPVELHNEALLALQEKYPDVVGWITIEDTLIDYPFVYSYDNRNYVDKNLDGENTGAGTIFMDYKNNPEFEKNKLIILYGHDMKNGSMFGTLSKYRKKDFFDSYPIATLCTANTLYKIEVFACAVISRYNKDIYHNAINTGDDCVAFLEAVKREAVQYRDTIITEEDQMIVLSTCSYDFSDSRLVVIGKLMPLTSKH